MFNKKKCAKCGEKLNKEYSYCPICGKPTEEKTSENWGMLGKNDFQEETNQFDMSFMGGMGGNMLGKMLNNAMKMLENEMQKEARPKKTNFSRSNIRLMINGKEIPINNQQPTQKNPTTKKITQKKNLPQNILKGFSKLPKEEPQTNIRRLSDKVIYEIKLVGVKSDASISIRQLEDSIEIKAITKEKAYQKIIPINLPIIDYSFSKESLVLELEAKN